MNVEISASSSQVETYSTIRYLARDPWLWDLVEREAEEEDRLIEAGHDVKETRAIFEDSVLRHDLARGWIIDASGHGQVALRYSREGKLNYGELLREVVECELSQCIYCGAEITMSEVRRPFLRQEERNAASLPVPLGPRSAIRESIVTRLRRRRFRRLENSGDTLQGVVCHTCGWWMVGRAMRHPEELVGFETYEFAVAVHSIVDLDDYDGPVHDLRTYLANHPDKLVSLSSAQFEELVAACMRDAFAGAEVHHVGGTGDGGVDILVVDGGRRPAVVQVKRRASTNATEGVQVVRELHGVMYRDGLSRGIVVSTADRFSKGAISEVERVSRKRLRGYQMRLMNRHDVAALLRVTDVIRPSPWETHDVPLMRDPYRRMWSAEEYYIDE